MRDGAQVVARLPYPLTEPKCYVITSEVATMDFVRLHGIPVPRVFAYSVTNENPVGTEYMIMEKVSGNELGNLWYTMTEEQRLKMLFQIVKIETLLFTIELPGSGSIYYEHGLPPGCGT
jgi:aminoglycoside phosphotransferase (APT) family kinase protein